MADKDAGLALGAAALRRLRARDRDLFPRLVRRWVLVTLWVVLAVVFAGLAVIAVVLGGAW